VLIGEERWGSWDGEVEGGECRWGWALESSLGGSKCCPSSLRWVYKREASDEICGGMNCFG
jgi:hypothetical protein